MKYSLLLAFALLIPQTAHAQLGKVQVNASFGAYLPNYGGVSNNNSIGWVAGAGAKYALPGHTSIFARASLADVGDIGNVGTADDYVQRGLKERTLIGGLSIATGRAWFVELGLGAMSRREVGEKIVGSPDPSFFPDGKGGMEGDWSSSAVASFGVGYGIGPITLTLRDMIGLDDITGNNNLSLSAGLRFPF